MSIYAWYKATQYRTNNKAQKCFKYTETHTNEYIFNFFFFTLFIMYYNLTKIYD